MTRSLLASLLLVTAGLALALGVGTPDPGAAERAYAGAAALLIIVAVYRSLARSRDAGSLEGRGALRNENARSTEGEEARDGATASWQELERSLRLGVVTAGNFDLRTRPRLAALARARAGRLSGHLSPADSEELLGADSVLRAGTSRLRNRLGPGISLEEIDRIVTILENCP